MQLLAIYLLCVCTMDMQQGLGCSGIAELRDNSHEPAVSQRVVPCVPAWMLWTVVCLGDPAL